MGLASHNKRVLSKHNVFEGINLIIYLQISFDVIPIADEVSDWLETWLAASNSACKEMIITLRSKLETRASNSVTRYEGRIKCRTARSRLHRCAPLSSATDNVQYTYGSLLFWCKVDDPRFCRRSLVLQLTQPLSSNINPSLNTACFPLQRRYPRPEYTQIKQSTCLPQKSTSPRPRRWTSHLLRKSTSSQ